MRVILALSGLIAACFHPSSVLAQTVATVSPSNGSPATVAAGPQIGSNEQVYPFNDGKCAVIDRRSNVARLTAYYAKAKWLGSCRFGVADGKGFIQELPGSYVPANFHHGMRIKPAVRMAGYEFSTQDNYLPDQVREIVQMDKKNNILQLDFGDKLNFSTLYDVSRRKIDDWFDTKEFSCSEGIKLIVPTINRQYLTEVQQLCGKQRAGAGGLPWARFVIHSREEYYGLTANELPSTSKQPNPVVVDIAVCSYPPGLGSCQAAYQKLLEPYRDRIQRVLVGDAAAQAAAISEVEARYAPLESAEAARMRAIASRIASETLNYVAPPAPKVGQRANLNEVGGSARRTAQKKGSRKSSIKRKVSQ